MSRRELYNITLNLIKILKKKYIENVLDVYSFQNDDLGQTNSSIVTKVLKKNDETKK